MKRHLALCILVLLSYSVVQAQKVKELFQTDELLEFTLTMDMKEVYRDVKERNNHPAQIRLNGPDGASSEIDLRVKVRGHTRTMKTTCRIPPLFLNFKNSETKGTPFEKQKKIKLVSHCKNSKSFQEYVEKEYLIYKLYNLVTPYSFKVRPCRITYVDSEKPEDSSTHFGFLIESIKDLAKRNDMKEFEELIRNQEALDKDNIDKLVLFQYMIGNLDWSVPERHNIKIMRKEDGSLPIAVPYDFDYSGLVDTPYAVPPEGIEIESVRTRVFRGLCRDQGYSSQIQFFKALQPKMMDEVNQSTFMDEKTRSEVQSYIKEFYKDINNPKTVTEKIDKACRAKHKHRYEY
jgi:hypothetical protein